MEVLVPRDGTIADVLAGLQKKANLDDETIAKTRVYEVHNFKIYKEFSPDSKFGGSNDFVALYAEKVPEEELELESGARTINAFNFDKETNKPHGVPFKFVMKQVSDQLYQSEPYADSSRVKSLKRPRNDYRSEPVSRASD